MTVPSAVDYSGAVQSPSAAFADAELARCRPAPGLFNAPLSFSGNFACVFKLLAPDGRAFAVKCFTRAVADLRKRYADISAHLAGHPRKFAVKFEYLAQGVRVGGQWHPVVKMDWIDGLRLNEFLAEHAGNAAVAGQLARLWLRLAGELREARMAHGDLQHGNVLLVDGGKAAMALRLIDYDGMWVPALAGSPPEEHGHPNYQHVARGPAGGWGADADRFSHLVISAALRALAVGGKSLWDRFDVGENLLFQSADFKDPARSRLWPELLNLRDPDAAALAAHLVLASQAPLGQVPWLGDVVTPAGVAGLRPDQQERLRAIVPGAPTLRPAAVVSAPPPSAPLPMVLPATAPSAALPTVLPADAPAVVVAEPRKVPPPPRPRQVDPFVLLVIVGVGAGLLFLLCAGLLVALRLVSRTAGLDAPREVLASGKSPTAAGIGLTEDPPPRASS